MAATAIALTKIPLNGGVELPAAAALDGTAGAEIQFDEQDTKIVILIENSGSSAGDVTFKAGNGIQGVADLVVNVANGKTKAVVLELSLIHISEPTRQAEISYAVFCLKKKKKK